MIPRVKITHNDRARMKELTMAWWWPNRYFPRPAPDWEGIAGELAALVKSEETFFVERGSNLGRLQELRALSQLAQDKVCKEVTRK